MGTLLFRDVAGGVYWQSPHIPTIYSYFPLPRDGLNQTRATDCI